MVFSQGLGVNMQSTLTKENQSHLLACAMWTILQHPDAQMRGPRAAMPTVCGLPTTSKRRIRPQISDSMVST